MARLKRWGLLLLVVGAVLTIDQVSKRLVVTSMELYESHQPIPAIEEVFQITRTFNNGAAFGFLPESGDVFLVIAVVVVFALFLFFPRIPEPARLTRLATGLVCGGALGNALDRLEYGHVVDFIHYQIPGIVSNVSNLADHAIVLGVLLIFYDNWRLERRLAQAEPIRSETAEPNADPERKQSL
jgi:signal peptidase II